MRKSILFALMANSPPQNKKKKKQREREGELGEVKQSRQVHLSPADGGASAHPRLSPHSSLPLSPDPSAQHILPLCLQNLHLFLLLSISARPPGVGGKGLGRALMQKTQHADTDMDRCTIRLTHVQFPDWDGSQKNIGFPCHQMSKGACVCVCEGYSRSLSASAACLCRARNIACQESPRDAVYFRRPSLPSLHQQLKPDINHLSTGRRPPTIPPPSSSTPSSLRPPPKPHQRHGTRQA